MRARTSRFTQQNIYFQSTQRKAGARTRIIVLYMPHIRATFEMYRFQIRHRGELSPRHIHNKEIPNDDRMIAKDRNFITYIQYI